MRACVSVLPAQQTPQFSVPPTNYNIQALLDFIKSEVTIEFLLKLNQCQNYVFELIL